MNDVLSARLDVPRWKAGDPVSPEDLPASLAWADAQLRALGIGPGPTRDRALDGLRRRAVSPEVREETRSIPIAFGSLSWALADALGVCTDGGDSALEQAARAARIEYEALRRRDHQPDVVDRAWERQLYARVRHALGFSRETPPLTWLTAQIARRRRPTVQVEAALSLAAPSREVLHDLGDALRAYRAAPSGLGSAHLEAERRRRVERMVDLAVRWLITGRDTEYRAGMHAALLLAGQGTGASWEIVLRELGETHVSVATAQARFGVVTDQVVTWLRREMRVVVAALVALGLRLRRAWAAFAPVVAVGLVMIGLELGRTPESEAGPSFLAPAPTPAVATAVIAPAAAPTGRTVKGVRPAMSHPDPGVVAPRGPDPSMPAPAPAAAPTTPAVGAATPTLQEELQVLDGTRQLADRGEDTTVDQLVGAYTAAADRQLEPDLALEKLLARARAGTADVDDYEAALAYAHDPRLAARRDELTDLALRIAVKTDRCSEAATNLAVGLARRRLEKRCLRSR